MNRLEKHRPPWAFAEHVKDMLDHDAEQAEVLVIRFRCIDFICAYVLIEHDNCGAKVRRPRAYFVIRCIRDAQKQGLTIWQTEQQLDAIAKLVKKLKVNGLDPDRFLLADDDRVLVHKLEDLKAVKA